MNKVFLIGNLTRDPELTETASGVKICRFAIAVNRSYSGGDGERKTDFFNCVAWRGLGETIARFTRKGTKVAVSGSIELRNYEDNQGIKRTAVDIVAQDVEFLSPRAGSSDYDEFSEPSQPAPGGRAKPQLQPFDDDSDIPF
ncbi:MAG: single-stranded DNA-binding protein [Clostridiales bacterium]|nr:single-stranded DNA-binding protein [Clostridiales bacterium]